MSVRATLQPRRIDPSLHVLLVKTIKTLSMDAVQRAQSGHPGLPMGVANLAAVLWTRFLVHDPTRPDWIDRDRFVLSAGHGSMLLYSLLHLTGYDLSIDELQRFRQWGSRTPGHPEYRHTAGVEVTTGPLGTGFAAGVGLALGERFLAARYNQPGHTVIDHFTYGIVSDGDVMEGIASEAASLAGHLGLGKLVYLYDDNGISIDGPTNITFTEDVPKRFEAYGWHVQCLDGRDPDAVEHALVRARGDADRPSLLVCKTVIADGSPNKAGTSKAHGEPLGAEEIAATKQALGWPVDAAFHVPAELRTLLVHDVEGHRGRRLSWEHSLERWRDIHPELAAELELLHDDKLPPGTIEALPTFTPGAAVATRKASAKVLAELVRVHPTVMGGSADLAGSNGVELPELANHSKFEPLGRVIRFGVREHGMAGVCNGLALHGAIRPFDATFLVFSDFMRGALRLSAVMGLPIVHVYSHDSFWLGEDGPTHQPVEHIMSLRMMPNLWVIRPADARETVAAWKLALTRTTGPTAILLTRQDVPILEQTQEDIARGGYVLWDPPSANALDGILIATGSEVWLALTAAQRLFELGRAVRVVSFPCWEAFAEQDAGYRNEVLPREVERRLSIEAGATLGWERYARHQHGIDHFGASAPGKVLADKFAFTPEAIVQHYLQL